MAQSSNESGGDPHRGRAAFGALDSMIHQGRSFSGRERHCCFLNTEGQGGAAGKWANVSAVSGLDFPDDGRAVGIVDWDRDGDLDAWISNRNAPRLRFLRNNLQSSHRFLSIRIIGNGEQTNRDAIGTRAEVIVRDSQTSQRKLSIKTVKAGDGFLSQSSKWLHFGLSKTDEIEKIRVYWASRGRGPEVEVFRDIRANRCFMLEQGTGVAKDVTSRRTGLDIVAGTPKELAKSDTANIRLAARLPVPPMAYQLFDSERLVPLKVSPDKTLLINLWSSQCRPCLEELAEFTQRESDILSANVEIVAISVDGLSKETSNSRDRQVISELAFPFASGHAHADTIAELQHLHDFVVPLHRPLPLPTSFLIDKEGRLATIYKGRLSVDGLLNDARSVVTAQDRLQISSFFDGTSVSHAVVTETALREVLRQRLKFADSLRKRRHFREAFELYAEILRDNPDLVPVHNNLGALYELNGQLQQAMKHYQRVLQLEPGHASAHNNLGNVFRAQGKTDIAKRHYQQALESNSQMFEAHNNLGTVFYAENEVVQAQSHLQRARKIRPDNFEVNYNLAAICTELGELGRAIELYEHALKIRPNNVQARNELTKL